MTFAVLRRGEKMDDLISRQNTLRAFEKCYNQCCREDEVGDKWIHYETALNEIESIPSAQPKKGKWIKSNEYARMTETKIAEWTNYYCSQCDSPNNKPTDFCPSCGAKMEMK